MPVSEPLVSVYVLTYNHRPFINRAIECALAQKTDFPFEVVIGEDCSTDGTREVVFDYAKRYSDIIRVVTSDSNVGMRRNSIRTAEACRGKYIAVCDGDDYWHRDDKLQIQADYLEGHPGCGLVFSDHDRDYLRTGRKICRFFRTTNNIPPARFDVFAGWGDRRTYCNMTPCTVMVRRNLWVEILGCYPYTSDEYLGGMDVAFCEVALVSDVHYIEESLATYTVQIESACRSRDLKKLAGFNLSVAGAYVHIAQKYRQTHTMQRVQKIWVRACVRAAFWERRRDLARKALEQRDLFGKADWLYYYGALSRLGHFVLCPVAWLHNSVYRAYVIR